jgi:hypothetical protein
MTIYFILTSNLIIADPPAFVSLTVKSDLNHARVVQLVQPISTNNRSVVIPCEVVAETVDILGKKFRHSKLFKPLR